MGRIDRGARVKLCFVLSPFTHHDPGVHICGCITCNIYNVIACNIYNLQTYTLYMLQAGSFFCQVLFYFLI